MNLLRVAFLMRNRSLANSTYPGIRVHQLVYLGQNPPTEKREPKKQVQSDKPFMSLKSHVSKAIRTFRIKWQVRWLKGCFIMS